MTKVFLTDIDNACLNYTDSFVDYLTKYYPEFHLNLDEYSFGIDESILEDKCHEFTLTDEFGDLKPLRDAKEYIDKIAELGYTFHGVTSCLPDASLKTYTRIHKLRTENLKRYFGNVFSGCTMILMHESKKKYLDSFVPTYYVDDKPKHVVDGSEVGHTSFLMDWPYNKKKDIGDGIRVTNWKEIYKKVLKDEKS